LWWDEAAYGSLAKNFILDGRWSDTYLIQHETFIRPLLFPILWAALLKIGFGEIGVRFLLQFLPSIIAVFFVYLISKELYGKKIALISTFIFSAIWVNLFYTARLLADNSALAFVFPSIYFFIKSQQPEFNAKYFGLSILLLSLATFMRYPIGVIFFAYLAFLFLTWRTDLLKNKKFWIAGLIGVLPILIFFVYNYANSGNIFPALLSGEYYGKDTGQPRAPIAFNLLKFILVFLKTPFFVFFIVGAAMTLFELFVGYDLIAKKQKLKAHLLTSLLFIVFFSFFIFSVRGAEDRYFMPISITFVSIAGIGADFVYESVKKYNKQIALVVLLGVLAFGAYQEVKYADSIIKDKQQSFLYERKGFEWIKLNTPEDSTLLGRGTGPYAVYYAERKYLEDVAKENISDMNTIDADYFIYNAYRPSPDYVLEYIQSNQTKWQPINGFFFDAQKTQPAFIVYKKF